LDKLALVKPQWC
jgi:hypothetical protein